MDDTRAASYMLVTRCYF